MRFGVVVFASSLVACSSTPQTQVVYVDVPSGADAGADAAPSSTLDASLDVARTSPMTAIDLDSGVHVSVLDAANCGCPQLYMGVTYDCHGQPAGCFEYDPCSSSGCGPQSHGDDITGILVPITCPDCPAGEHCQGSPNFMTCSP